MKEENNYSIQGRKNRNRGRVFESKVRADLESKDWIVAKWANQVDLENNKLVPAKHKFNFFTKVMAMGTGFPDFIAFKKIGIDNVIIGVESKVGKYLDKIEKVKAQWLLDNKIFSEIRIAYKDSSSIKYRNFLDTKNIPKGL